MEKESVAAEAGFHWRRRGSIRVLSSSAASRATLLKSLSSVARHPRDGSFSPAQILRNVCFLFISITLSGANHRQLAAQQVTTVAPPRNTAADALPDAPTVPDSAGDAKYPDAEPIPLPGSDVHIESTEPQTMAGGLYTLDGNVVVTYRDRTLKADHIEYDSDSGDVSLTGHVVITIGESDEHIEASHGTINLQTQTGRFYDVSGAVGLGLGIGNKVQRTGKGTAAAKSPGALPADNQRYTNGNPFLFTGKTVVKTGPRQYQIYGGTFTSCQLPRPDWLLSGSEFTVDGDKAHATNSIFRLMSIPLLWLPYVTHPVNANDRQTGILIPEIGFNSASKGDTVGEQIYWAINRSTDLTVGSIYYSARGYEQTASFHYQGLAQDFARARYSGLQDRGYYPGGGKVYVNQSGTDVTFSGRHDLADYTEAVGDSTATATMQARVVADVEYLSSFPYREAFSTNFNQAVSSDVVSTVYATRESSGAALSLEGDRYQGEKRVANTTVVPRQTEQQVHIFHAPALEFTTTDHALGSTGIEWNVDSSAAALKRTQPFFETSGMVERLDAKPELAYPLHFGGWNLRPSIAGRETFYTRSRIPVAAGQAPKESKDTLNRTSLDLRIDLRPPVLERTFDSGFLRNLLRHDVRHTVEPDFTYRFVHGIDNFPDVLRFDTVDVASNTNEMEYGVTQRLFLRRPEGQPCRASGTAADAVEILQSAGKASDNVEDPGEAMGRADTAEPVCGNREWISWRIAQKYFFDPGFGGAVATGPRSILDTTLNFSGISFLTRPRNISPIISRLHVRTSEKTDVEWDMDYDFCSASPGVNSESTACERKFTANNVYANVHQGDIFAGISYARLNAPGRSYVAGVTSSVAEFNQMRFRVGFGGPTKPHLSAAASAGIDLDLGSVQYGSVQASYNWNCCGISVEYRKYELGTTRNDNGYKFNFTLANIGSAGNLRHQDQLF
jgi:LPS-assembly protein